MKDINGKIALITGGAEGIGFHTAKVLGQQGMKLILVDINDDKLQEAVNALTNEAIEAEGVVMDVSVRAEWDTLAEKIKNSYGKLHFLMSNAGVSIIGSQRNMSESDWRWLIDVNLMGVVYGCQMAAPLMKAQEEGGHIMNVASIAGLHGVSYSGPYCATKAAVVSLSETWRTELAKDGIEVSVLCPGFVKSRIYDSGRIRQDRYGGQVHFEELVKQKPGLNGNKDVVVNGIDTEIAAARVLEGLMNNDAYIFTHPHFKQSQIERGEAIKAAFERAEQSPALKDVPHSGDVFR